MLKNICKLKQPNVTTLYIIVGAMRCELPIVKLSSQLHLTSIYKTLPTTFTTSKYASLLEMKLPLQL
jgi:hypothetical protein